MSGSRKNTALASKIKRMMQSDEDVGKIAQQTPAVIAHAMETFLEQLAQGSSEIATSRADKVLSGAHLKSYINANPSMDFLKEIVAKAPDLKDKAASPRGKRQRKTEDGEKQTRKKAKASEEQPSKGTPRKGKQSKAAAKKGAAPAEEADLKAEVVKEEKPGITAVAVEAGPEVEEVKIETSGGDQVKPGQPVEEAVEIVHEELKPGGPVKEEEISCKVDLPSTAADLAEEDDYDAD